MKEEIEPMALFTIDKLRFRNILVRGQLPEETAVEFAEALEETLEPLAETSGVDRAVQRAIDQIKLDAAEREARSISLAGLPTWPGRNASEVMTASS